MVRRILIAVGLVLAYLIPTNTTEIVSGQTDITFGCKFQQLTTDGSSIMEHLSVTGNDPSYYTRDPEISGLHFNGTRGQWAAIDVLAPTRSPFANGGKVSAVNKTAQDPAGGGWGIIIDGTEDCQNWIYFSWHLPEPSILNVGDIVDPRTTISSPGCTGFEGYCGLSIPAHNHIGIGRYSNTNPFPTDVAAYQISYRGQSVWLIHPARIELSGENSAFSTPIPSSLLIPLGPEGANAKSTSWPFSLLTERIEFDKYLLPPGWILGGVFLFLLVVTLMTKKNWIIFSALLIGVALIIMLIDKVDQPQFDQALLIPMEQSRAVIPLTTGDSNWNTPTLVLRTPVGNNDLNPRWPESIQQWGDWISEYAKAYNVDPDLIAAIALQESGGYQWRVDPVSKVLTATVSYAGATGYLQIMPSDNPKGFVAFNDQGVEYFSGRCSRGGSLDRDTVFNDGCRPYYGTLAKDPKLVTNFGIWLLRVYKNATGSWANAVRTYGHQTPNDPWYYTRIIKTHLANYAPEKAYLLDIQ